jgi:TonB-dependent receptor
MKNNRFTKTQVATSLSIALGAFSAPMVYAADEAADNVEVIEVRGIRGSLVKSTAMKRNATGVVDSISSEDIGKFPDTNLAESLQRITGVSIDRENGEGSKVTVRGFGPDFNMVTLNGRTMPASSLPGGGGTANSRAFDFSNLASDAVSAVAVYKTGQASIATGGIGATIDIVTGKPLDNPGMHASIGGKALMDTTNRVGSDITPELSGLFSWTDEEETLGASITFNTQKRDSSASGAFVNQWKTNPYDGVIPKESTDISLTNEPDIGQLYSIPSDLRYKISDRERERVNTQVTLQYRPIDRLTATLDYTYSKQDLFEARAEQSVWIDDSYTTELTFDDEIVTTPVDFTQDRLELAPRDLGLALQELNQVNENNSVGLNLVYEVSDELVLVFDAHSSTAESSPDAPYGSWMNVGLGANVVAGQSVDYSKEFPIMTIDFDDCDAARGLNCNTELDISDVGTSILDMNRATQKSTIDEVRLSGSYEMDFDGIELLESGKIDFGIGSRTMESHSQQSLTRHTMGNWGIENPGELPEGYLDKVNFLAEFDDYDTTGAFSQGFTGDAAQIATWAAEEYGFDLVANNANATDRTITEEITTAFAQFSTYGYISELPFNLSVGLRYENTDITSSAQVTLPNAVAWESDNDFNVRFGEGAESYSESASYDHLLPSLNFDISLRQDVKARFSYSTTIARPTYDQLSTAASDVSGPTGPTILTGTTNGSASNGNVALIPLESDNIDLSVEWYFDDASYVSVGYYQKNIANFTGREPVTENVYGLRDATAGPRALAAQQALIDLDIAVTDANLFGMIAATENGITFNLADVEQYGIDYDILPNSDDPLMDFNVTKFVNNEEASIDGFELAIQHFFGDSGFGFQANYTTVNGDIGFDNNGDPSITQFALVGLSDTANLVAIYEKDGFQARIAYNWRDKFLNSQARFVNEPGYTEAYAQIDFNASYQVNEELSVFFEGINLTGEDTRTHGRTAAQLWSLEEQKARFALGARYNF